MTGIFFAIRRLLAHRCLQQWCVLGWLALCQLPLPIAHAHAGLADLESPTLAGHVQHYHASDLHTHELHWHWLMPWDLASRNTDGNEPNPSALPAGCGVVRGDGIATRGLVGNVQPSLLYFAGGVPPTSLAAHVQLVTASRSLQNVGASFSQTYRGISMQSLIGVCLC
jgi:hypothetical protein